VVFPKLLEVFLENSPAYGPSNPCRRFWASILGLVREAGGKGCSLYVARFGVAMVRPPRRSPGMEPCGLTAVYFCGESRAEERRCNYCGRSLPENPSVGLSTARKTIVAWFGSGRIKGLQNNKNASRFGRRLAR